MTNFDIDDNLIVKFRDVVNSNSYFILHMYKNIENKNRWNIICSCMDWISVAIRTLEKFEIIDNNDDKFSMQVFSYISKIDIIYEAILQLHRVLIDKKTIPFDKNKTIFKNNNSNKDDNEYFKHLRAVFGAHPVNIKDDDKNQWFASWPYSNTFKEYDLEVRLYSNEVGKEDITVGIMISELNQFLYQRYYYLNELIDNINNQFKNYCKKKRNTLIKKDDNLIKQLRILEEEAKNRLNNDYYIDTIDSLIVLLSVKTDICKNKYIIEYKKQLEKVVQEVFNNLQNMKIIDLKTNDIISSKYPIETSYEISKLLVLLRDNNYDPLFSYYVKVINNRSNGEITLNESDSKDELYLKIKTMIYFNLWY